MTINMYFSTICIFISKFSISQMELIFLRNVCFYLFPFYKLASQSFHSPKLKPELIIDFTHVSNPLSVLMSCRPLNAFCHCHC